MQIKSVFVIAVCIIAGWVAGQFWQGNSFWQSSSKPPIEGNIYRSAETELLEKYLSMPVTTLTWSDLLPTEEKARLTQYQSASGSELVDQIVASISASSDNAYKAAMKSSNTVEALNGRAASIPGFIVPLDVTDDRKVRSFFLVPYYGACIHYPPPPPNQLIYISLPEGISHPQLMQAVMLRGIIRTGMFEDPAGTSAYLLDVVSIATYEGQPDDVRIH